MSNVANKSFQNGLVNVGTSAAKLCTIPAGCQFVIIVPTAAIVIGGPNVATSGAQQGVPVGLGVAFQVPNILGVSHDLYAVAASPTTCAVLLPL
jgi:hypothetical protein